MKNLLRLRKLNGLTQKQLGLKVDCDGNTISRYERGAITPSMETSKKLAAYFGVSIDELLNGESKKEFRVELIISEGDDDDLIQNMNLDGFTVNFNKTLGMVGCFGARRIATKDELEAFKNEVCAALDDGFNVVYGKES